MNATSIQLLSSNCNLDAQLSALQAQLPTAVSSASSGLPLPVLAGAAGGAVVLILLIVLIVLLRRRRK